MNWLRYFVYEKNLKLFIHHSYLWYVSAISLPIRLSYYFQRSKILPFSMRKKKLKKIIFLSKFQKLSRDRNLHTGPWWENLQKRCFKVTLTNISNVTIPVFFLEFSKTSQFSPRKEVSVPGEQFWD